MPEPPLPSLSTIRNLPSVDRLTAHNALTQYPVAIRLAAARAAIAAARERVLAGGEAPSVESLAQAAASHADLAMQPSPRPVINASGVLLHTNLGRAPLSEPAIAAMAEVMRGYSNLEYDLSAGTRGTRFSHVEPLLQRVTGAPAGIAVNNNAAAMLLALSALCRDREVIISRSQAVEIGGGFRIPDVLRQSGAILVEVGTTNRTTVGDFESAISQRTAAILRVHASNFRVIGFTAFPALPELTALAHAHNVLMIDDLGSGCLLDTVRFGMAHEPTVQESVVAGVDVIAFSGDKLLGGPQAGILVGAAEPLAIVRRHPLARAVRMDKGSLAALAVTLRHYADGDPLAEIPIWQALSTPLPRLRARARRWAQIDSTRCTVRPGRTMVGGGSLPEEGVATAVLAVQAASPDRLAAALRGNQPPIIARISAGLLLLDPRTVLPGEDAYVAAALARVLGAAEHSA